MKNKTLCLYWPQYDKILNFTKIVSGNDYAVQLEFKFSKNQRVIQELSREQVGELKDWMKDNGI